MNESRRPVKYKFLILCLISALFTSLYGENTKAKPKLPWDSMFSIGGDAATNRNAGMNKSWVPEMRTIGIDTMRTVDVVWFRRQRKEGPIDFKTLDNQVSYLKSQGMTFGGTLSGCPRWVGGRGLPVGNGAEEKWAEYIRAVVSHLKDDVKVWEIWNEPPNFTNKNKNPKDYATTVVTAYKTIKAVDPTAWSGISAKSAHIGYLDRAIRGGAKDHFDFITLHPYELLGMVYKHPGTEPIFMAIAPTTRKMLKKHMPKKVNMPIWFTELGANAKHLGEKGQAVSLVKAYVMSIAQGIASISWFEGRDGDSGPMGLMLKNKQKRIAYTAMAEMIKYYGQQPKAVGWLMLNDKHYAFIAQGKNGYVLSTWTSTKEPDTVDFGAEATIVDPLTGKTQKAKSLKLTLDPILVLNPPKKVIQIAKLNQKKPLPWDGDYSKAKSVSVTYGRNLIEKGLHTKSAKSIAKDIVLYGGSCRAGNVPGGNVFMIDPAFLSYDTVPIEITIEARRNEKNKPEKITLEYENTDVEGYKKLPPFQIPDNKQWHSHTWRIHDCQFVNTWAFSFRINKGTYAIKKVTVTRLDR